MNLRRFIILASSAALGLALMAMPRAARAQDEECVGTEPRGGRAVSSAELYIKYAGRAAGDLEEQQKMYHEGLDELERDIDAHPDDPNPQVYVYAGQIYAELGRYIEADAAWTEAVDLWSCYEARVDTLRYNAWVKVFNRAVSYSRNDDHEKAIQAYEDAWTLYKKNPQPMLQLGALYAQEAVTAADSTEKAAATEKALEYYQKAIGAIRDSDRMTPEERSKYLRPASFNLAQLLAADGQFEAAAAAYAEFLEFEPGDVDATSNAAVVLTRAARKYTRDAADMAEGPERDALLAKADSLRRVAVDYYSSLVNREDLDASDYHNIGLGLAQIGLNEDAVAAFSHALELEPYRANSLEQLGLALFRNSQYDSLIVVARELAERYPLNLNNLAMLANGYRETDEADSALAVLERREALKYELDNVRLASDEGTYTLTGHLTNLKADVGTTVELKFDFYDDRGEVVQSETVTVTAPEQGSYAEFRQTFDSDALITGYSYEQVST